MLRTASIKLRTNRQQSWALSDLRAAYAEACNRLVPEVMANCCWNRVVLHHKAYYRLRRETSLGSQMVCNAIFTVSKAYQSQKELGRIKKDVPLPAVSFARTSVHFDKRTYSMRGEWVSLYTLVGRQRLPMLMGKHCGALGVRLKHRFSCSCGLRAHSDVNAARNHARMGGAIALSRAAVNQPDVAEISF